MYSRRSVFSRVCSPVGEINESYLYSEIDGESFESETVGQFLQGVIAECSDLGVKKSVVVNRIHASVSNSGLFAVIVNIGESGLKGLRLAIVDPDHQDMNDFGNLVAENRGIQIRFFTNIGSAEIWLRLDKNVTVVADSFWSRIDQPTMSRGSVRPH